MALTNKSCRKKEIKINNLNITYCYKNKIIFCITAWDMLGIP